MKVVVLIPALNPDDALVNTVRECISLGLRHIIVVDDGSAAEYQPVFDKVQEQGAMVLHHAHNRGKGAALKPAWRRLQSICRNARGCNRGCGWSAQSGGHSGGGKEDARASRFVGARRA